MQAREHGQVRRAGNLYLKGALGTAAMAASRTKDTYLSARYRRIASRRGPIKAIVALEHTLLIAVWHMITTDTHYADPGGDYLTRRRPAQARDKAIDQLTRLGYTVTITPKPRPAE